MLTKEAVHDTLSTMNAAMTIAARINAIREEWRAA
jgi:hypothetical protein